MENKNANTEEITRVCLKWRERLEKIGKDLGWLLLSHEIFSEVQNIFRNNPNIRSPRLFYWWIADNYSAQVSIGVSRLSKRPKMKEEITLYGLIDDISKNSCKIDREYYVSEYLKDTYERGIADKLYIDDEKELANIDFDKFQKHISKANSDLQRLKKATKLVNDFRDKYIAHCDEDQEGYNVPAYKDVAQALQRIDKIYCKYRSLITGNASNTSKILDRRDWKESLRHPWIELTDKEKQRQLRKGKVVWDARRQRTDGQS